MSRNSPKSLVKEGGHDKNIASNIQEFKQTSLKEAIDHNNTMTEKLKEEKMFNFSASFPSTFNKFRRNPKMGR